VFDPDFGFRAWQPVVVYLHTPKEKVWGLLVSINTSGVTVRGLDVAVFEDWMRQEARRQETMIGLTTLFYPASRLERLELDETVGPVLSLAQRFEAEVGRTVHEVLQVSPPKLAAPGARHVPVRRRRKNTRSRRGTEH
jgi:hypothetical protein